MRKMNKKGFTIVELVIVIAVIAILAAVMIPTFGGIVDKANKSAALQEATNVYKALLTEDTVTPTGGTAITVKGDTDFAETGVDLYIVADNVVFAVTNGEIAATELAVANIAENYKALSQEAYTAVYVYTTPVVAEETTEG